MLISHKYKFIFIHNYKIAGQSIRKALGPYASLSLREDFQNDPLFIIRNKHSFVFSRDFDPHLTAMEIKRQIPSCFRTYYKFGFVRNPWDWQVSLYHYIKIDTANKHHELVTQLKSFENYIEWRVNHDRNLQKDFFYANNTCLVDFIGRFENLKNDFDFVTNKLGINCFLPHLNKSRPDNSYLNYYTPKTIELVYEAFQEDILTFGYTKPVIPE